MTPMTVIALHKIGFRLSTEDFFQFIYSILVYSRLQFCRRLNDKINTIIHMQHIIMHYITKYIQYSNHSHVSVDLHES